MKRNILIWVGISVLVVLAYAITKKWSPNIDPLMLIGELFVPLIATLIIPLFVSFLYISVIYLFTKNNDLKKHFSKAMWVSQIIMASIFVLSILGNLSSNTRSSQTTSIQNTKIVSNDFIELSIPQDWKSAELEILEPQLYNILCYNEIGSIRLSSILNPTGLSPKSYYLSFKEVLLNDVKTNTQNFTIIHETSFSFLGQDAYKVIYEADYKNTRVYAESICFSDKDQLIILSSSSTKKELFDQFPKIYRTIKIK